MKKNFMFLLAVMLVLGLSLTVGTQPVEAGANLNVRIVVSGDRIIGSNLSGNDSFINNRGDWFIVNITSNETINMSASALILEITNISGTAASSVGGNHTTGWTIVNNNGSTSGNYSYKNVSGFTISQNYYIRVIGWAANASAAADGVAQNLTAGRLLNFTLDKTFPETLSITTPTAAQDFVQSSPTIDLNYSAGDYGSRITCITDRNGVNFTISENVNSSCSNITFQPLTGGNNVIVWVNDSANNVNRSVLTFTFRQLATGGGGGGGGGGSGGTTALPGSVVTITFGNLVTQQRKALNTAGGTPVYIMEINPAIDISNAQVDMQVVAFPVTPNTGRKNYAHMELDPSFTNNDILGARVNFKVPKAWLTENNVKEASLWRYNNGQWKEMPTTKVSEDELNMFYKSDIPGFSLFSISEASGLTFLVVTGDDILTGATGGSLVIEGFGLPYWVIIIIIVAVILFIVWWKRR